MFVSASRLLIVSSLFAASALALGQTKRQIPATPTTAAPVIDGSISEPAWTAAPKATGFVDVASGSPAEDQTTVSILYDEKNIYIAFDCRDSRPDAIVARDTARDSKFQRQGERNTEDNVEVDFDPFLTHSGNDQSAFSVNPLGTRSAYFAGGRGSKAEWNGEWEAAAKRTATGWTAEMRIPWSSLNYPTGKDHITMGINFSRYIDRTKRVQEWSWLGTQRIFQENEGLWTDVKLPSSAFHPRLSILPYVLGGIGSRTLTGKAGVDMRYPITPQLTAVGSINPDYSNIAGALQTIQFSYTEPFVPEYRPFFSEGGDYFDIPWSANSMDILFYSRRIPTFDLGAKVYGKATPKDTIGALDTYNYSGRNDTVLRYLHNYSDTSSGGLMVIRKDSTQETNTLALADGHARWGKLGLDSVGMKTFGQSDFVPNSDGGAGTVSTYYQDKFLTTILHLSTKSSNFYDANGLIPLTDYRGYWYSNFLRYNWQHGALSTFQFVFNEVDFRHQNGSPFDRESTQRVQFFTRNDWLIAMDHNEVTFEGLHDRTVGMEVTKGFRNRFQSFSLYVSTGETGSVPTTLVVPGVKLRVLKKLDVLYSGVIQNRLGIQQQHVTTLNYELSPTRSFGGRVVNQDAFSNAYFFYRNSGGRGTEYYIILGDPNARSTVRSLQVKAVFAF